MITDIKVYYKDKTVPFVTTPVHVDKIEMKNIGSDGSGVEMGELISIILSGALNGIANELPGAIGNGIKSGLKELGNIGGVELKNLEKAATKQAEKAVKKELNKLFGDK